MDDGGKRKNINIIEFFFLLHDGLYCKNAFGQMFRFKAIKTLQFTPPAPYVIMRIYTVYACIFVKFVLAHELNVKLHGDYYLSK